VPVPPLALRTVARAIAPTRHKTATVAMLTRRDFRVLTVSRLLLLTGPVTLLTEARICKTHPRWN